MQENEAQCQGEPEWGAKDPPQQQLYQTELVALVTAQDTVSQGKGQGICMEGGKLVWVSDMGKTRRQAMLCFRDAPLPCCTAKRGGLKAQPQDPRILRRQTRPGSDLSSITARTGWLSSLHALLWTWSAASELGLSVEHLADISKALGFIPVMKRKPKGEG